MVESTNVELQKWREPGMCRNPLYEEQAIHYMSMRRVGVPKSRVFQGSTLLCFFGNIMNQNILGCLDVCVLQSYPQRIIIARA